MSLLQKVIAKTESRNELEIIDIKNEENISKGNNLRLGHGIALFVIPKNGYNESYLLNLLDEMFHDEKPAMQALAKVITVFFEEKIGREKIIREVELDVNDVPGVKCLKNKPIVFESILELKRVIVIRVFESEKAFLRYRGTG